MKNLIKKDIDVKKMYEHIPLKVGVYFFKNNLSQIIYIGKAKSLKKRVSSYFSKKNSDWKIDSLILESASIDYILTENEHEALVLEAKLVKEYQPKFNILLKSGDPFLYIFFSQNKMPVLKMTRFKKDKGDYFGPFINKHQARSLFNFIIKSFQLFSCNKTIENGCLDYHLGRCSGTCLNNFDNEFFKLKIELAKLTLSSDHKDFLKKIDLEISNSIDELSFEKARNLQEYKLNAEKIFEIIKKKYHDAKYDQQIASVTTEKINLDNYDVAANDLKDLLNLKKTPETIDCFDISHFQSNSLVGSCIRFLNGQPDKNNFKKFKIKTLIKQDDYACLAEIISRRYKTIEDCPDLILIDGGKGQLSAAREIVGDYPCVSIAKDPDRLFYGQNPKEFILDVSKPIGKLIISLRDYAHHFAISYHRLLQRKKYKN